MATIWEIRNWLEQNALVVIGVGLIAILAAVSVPLQPKATGNGWIAFQPKGYSRGKRMLRQSRKAFVLNLLTQDFVDRVETRVYNEEISRQEATEAYRLMKRLFPIRNLFPTPELLKEKINHRLGTHTEANFPDKKPRVKRKHMFDEGTVVERVVL